MVLVEFACMPARLAAISIPPALIEPSREFSMGHHFGVTGGRGIGLEKVWRVWARGTGGLGNVGEKINPVWFSSYSPPRSWFLALCQASPAFVV